MNRTLIATTAVLVLTASHAHAQWVVVDPTLNSTALASFGKAALTELHEAQGVINTAQTVVNTLSIVNSVAHGNYMGIMALAPLFGTTGMTDPLGSDAGGVGDLMSGAALVGNMGGQVMSLYNRAKAEATIYAPTGQDFQAQAILQRTRAAAGQLATSQQYMNSTTTRLQALPILTNNAQNTADLKAAADAGNTLAGQQLQQSAQANHLMALQLNQRAIEALQRSQEEQEWRRGTDAAATSNLAGEAAAKGGTIAFITP